MDIFGNLMLGCWFLFVSFMCVGCAYIIMRDKVPPKRKSYILYYGWKSIGYLFYSTAFLVFCAAANNFYQSHHNFILWIRS